MLSAFKSVMRRVAASAAQRLTEVRARWRAFLLDQGFNGGPEDSLDDPPGTELKPLIPRGLTWLVFRCCARRPRRVRSAHAATQYRVHAPYMAKSPRARCLHAWVAAYTLLRGSAQGTSLHPTTTPTSVPTISSPVSLTGSPRNHKDLYGSLCECVGSCWIGWLQVFVLVMHKLIHCEWTCREQHRAVWRRGWLRYKQSWTDNFSRRGTAAHHPPDGAADDAAALGAAARSVAGKYFKPQTKEGVKEAASELRDAVLGPGSSSKDAGKQLQEKAKGFLEIFQQSSGAFVEGYREAIDLHETAHATTRGKEDGNVKGVGGAARASRDTAR